MLEGHGQIADMPVDGKIFKIFLHRVFEKYQERSNSGGMVGGAMVLGKLPSAERPTNLD